MKNNILRFSANNIEIKSEKQETNSWCGVATVQLFLKHYGINKTQQELAMEMKIGEKDKLSSLDLVIFLNKYFKDNNISSFKKYFPNFIYKSFGGVKREMWQFQEMVSQSFQQFGTPVMLGFAGITPRLIKSGYTRSFEHWITIKAIENNLNNVTKTKYFFNDPAIGANDHFYGKDIENLFHKAGGFLLCPINFQKNKTKRILISNPITGKEPLIDLNQEEAKHVQRIAALFKSLDNSEEKTEAQLQEWKKLDQVLPFCENNNAYKEVLANSRTLFRKDLIAESPVKDEIMSNEDEEYSK